MQTFVTQTRNVSLVMILLVTLTARPTKALAQGQVPSPDPINNPCEEVISACDLAIEKRNQLINLQANRIDQLRDQNQQLSNALVKLAKETEGQGTEKLLYAGGGLLIGIIAGFLVAK